MLVPKGVRHLGGLADMIISLYARGMTIREIKNHLASTVCTELSHETISNVVDEIANEVLEWQNSSLEAFYPVIYLDAIVVKVRDSGHVHNKSAYLAVGVDLDGIKPVLGIWIAANKGAKFWSSVCANIAILGVRGLRRHRSVERAKRQVFEQASYSVRAASSGIADNFNHSRASVRYSSNSAPLTWEEIRFLLEKRYVDLG